jgi:hypothetical protein
MSIRPSLGCLRSRTPVFRLDSLGFPASTHRNELTRTRTREPDRWLTGRLSWGFVTSPSLNCARPLQHSEECLEVPDPSNTSRAVHVVSHHLDSLLHARPAGLLHPAVDHEVRRVSFVGTTPCTEVPEPVLTPPRGADLSPRRMLVLDSGTASLRPLPSCRCDQCTADTEASAARSPLDFMALFRRTHRSVRFRLPSTNSPLFFLGFFPLRGHLPSRRPRSCRSRHNSRTPTQAPAETSARIKCLSRSAASPQPILSSTAVRNTRRCVDTKRPRAPSQATVPARAGCPTWIPPTLAAHRRSDAW